jgi:hypothetical protein
MATIFDALLVRLQDIRTSEYELTVLRDRLSLLAVADGGKPAFEALLDECPSDAAEALARVARELGLAVKLVVLDSTCHLRTPNVPPLVVKAVEDLWRPRRRTPSLWIARRFLDIPRRERSVPESSSGIYLGYPLCCVTAYVEKTRQRTEVFHRLAQEHNPGRRDDALAAWIRSDPTLKNAEVQRLLGRNSVESSDEAFPFVPHVACPDCLVGKNEATRRHNAYFEQLASRVGLRDKVLNAVADFLSRCRASDAPVV